MKKLLASFSILTLMALSPTLVFAQTSGNPIIQNQFGGGVSFSNTASSSTVTVGASCTAGGSIGILFCTIQNLLNTLIPLMILLGTVYFVWGVVQYMIGGGEEAKKKGRDRIVYGLIGFAVIFGMWGFVNLIVKTFNFSGSANLSSLIPTTSATTQSTSSCTVVGSTSKFQDGLNYIVCILESSVIPFIFAIAVVMFIWGMANFFIIGADEEAKRSKGKQFMIWGVIAITVMLSMWGIVKVLGTTFGVYSSTLPHVTPPTN